MKTLLLGLALNSATPSQNTLDKRKKMKNIGVSIAVITAANLIIYSPIIAARLNSKEE